MTKRMHQIVGIVLVLLLTACSSGKGPAEAAIKSAESAFAAVKDDALKYVPDQAHAVEASLDSARASFNKGDYAAATTAVNDALPKISALAPAVASRKEQYTRQGAELSQGVPKMVAAIQSRVDLLSKSKSLPSGLDRATFDSAKSGVAELSRMWSDTSAQYQSGNVADAVASATVAKDRAAS